MPESRKKLKASERGVVELNINSPPPAKSHTVNDYRGLDRGFKLSKSQETLCSLDSNVSPEGYDGADSQPDEIADAQKVARDWHKKNLFVQQGVALKLAFCNYDLRLKPRSAEGSKVQGSNVQSRLKLREWWEVNELAVTR